MGLPYNLGEMKSETGEVLRYEVESTASDIAIKIAELIQDYSIYQEIIERIKSPKTSLYFQKAIKSEIYPVVINLCVLRWYKRKNIKIDREVDTVSVPSTGIYLLLDKAWPDQTIPLKFSKKVSMKKRIESFYRSSRSLVRRSVDDFWGIYCRWKYTETFRNFQIKNGMIAVQFVEGIDLQRRSDIVWYAKSKIDPKRILIYFTWPDHEPIDENIIQSIEAMGMRWVCLNRSSSKNKNAPVWYPPFNHKKVVVDLHLKPADEIEKWICKLGRKLFDDVNYWSAFHKAFNIKIHFITGGSDLKYIAQSIAFDLFGSKCGFLAGKERSELHWPPVCIIGSYPVDVFFTWTPRANKYLSPNVDQIIASVAAGYPNDLIFEDKQSYANALIALLRSKGVDYTIALFDNVHGANAVHSTANMERFYLTFLNWLIEDPRVGMLIKSKKPSVLQSLPTVLPVLEKAEATGRCIRLGDEFGRLPVDASLASDISVGIGVSSAVIESAIAGCRSIHCDLTHFRSHEFYQWGYERIIFDDLERLLTAMKDHKAGNRNCSKLGDWTPFLDRLDPFRDGRAGERMGTYLRWCLEGFDEGLDRNAVIGRANGEYNARWGDDKAVFLPHPS